MSSEPEKHETLQQMQQRYHMKSVEMQKEHDNMMNNDRKYVAKRPAVSGLKLEPPNEQWILFTASNTNHTCPASKTPQIRIIGSYEKEQHTIKPKKRLEAKLKNCNVYRTQAMKWQIVPNDEHTMMDRKLNQDHLSALITAYSSSLNTNKVEFDAHKEKLQLQAKAKQKDQETTEKLTKTSDGALKEYDEVLQEMQQDLSELITTQNKKTYRSVKEQDIYETSLAAKTNANDYLIDEFPNDLAIPNQLFCVMSILPDKRQVALNSGLDEPAFVSFGCYPDKESAKKRAEEVGKIIIDFHIDVVDMYRWIPIGANTTKSIIMSGKTETKYRDEKLDEIIKQHKATSMEGQSKLEIGLNILKEREKQLKENNS